MGGTERAEHAHAPESAELEPAAAPALVVGDAFDPAEREAEQVAERVLATLGAAGGEHQLHESPAAVSRRADGDGGAMGLEGGAVSADLAQDIQGAQGSGSPLPGSLRRSLETAMNADLGGVRIHTGATAARSSAAIGARAYTTGKDIFFGAGEFQPDTEDGLRTIAHEVTHTVQNSAAGAGVQRRLAGALDRLREQGGSGRIVVRPVAAPSTAAPSTAEQDTEGKDGADTETPAVESAAVDGAAAESAEVEGKDGADTETPAAAESAEVETKDGADTETPAAAESAEVETKDGADTETPAAAESAEVETKDGADTETPAAAESAEVETKDGADTESPAAAESAEVAAAENSEIESDEVEDKDGADTDSLAPAATAGRVALTSWDRILNSVNDYEKRETGLKGKSVDAHMRQRGALTRDLDDIKERIANWEKVKAAAGVDAKTTAARSAAVAALYPNLRKEEGLLDDGDPTEWLEKLGFSEDDVLHDDGSVDYAQAEDGKTVEGDDGPALGSAGEKTEDEKTEDGGAGVDAELTGKADAAADLDELLKTESTNASRTELKDSDLSSSAVAEAVAELKDKDDDNGDASAPDVEVLERVLAKVQVIDAVAEHVIEAKDEARDDDTSPVDAAGELKDVADELPALALTGEDLGRALVQLALDDVETALRDLLPVKEIEEVIQRIEEVKAEVEAELDALEDQARDAVQEAKDVVTGVRDEVADTLAAANVTVEQIDAMLADPTVLAVAAAELIVPDAVRAALAQKDYYTELGVSSSKELTTYVDDIVGEVLEGFGGADLRPGLEDVLEDMAKDTVEAIHEAMTVDGGPNQIVATFVAEHRIDPKQVPDVVETALSAYLDKSVLGTLAKQTEAAAAPAAAIAKSVLNADFASRITKSLFGKFL